MSDCGCEVEVKNKEQRNILFVLLAINAFMFVLEFGFGWHSESTGLIADSIDMLADALVYSVGLYAVGKSSFQKAKAAQLSGILQMLIGTGVLLDVMRRIFFGSDPESISMVLIGFLALIANVICLLMISKHKEGEIHMRASWIFSKNDVLANIGVILAGVLVAALQTRIPDIIIGLIITAIILKGGLKILKEVRSELIENNE